MRDAQQRTDAMVTVMMTACVTGKLVQSIDIIEDETDEPGDSQADVVSLRGDFDRLTAQTTICTAELALLKAFKQGVRVDAAWEISQAIFQRR